VSGLLVPGGPGLVSARRVLAALLCGTVFGAGLAVAQRTNPRKVVGFLDFTRAWDPSLLPVLGGAVILSAVAFQRETAQRRPPARRFTTATMRSTSSQVL